MSDHTLSEDYSKWPDDPYTLLGVQHGIGPKDLKRAYTRLIRIWKPEQYPEHFRRIREAYEHVLRYVELFGGMDSSAPPAPIFPQPLVPGTSLPLDEIADPLPPSPEPRADAELPDSHTDELKDYWERAIRGEEEEAYRGLKRLHHQRPHNTAIVLRLYWLLSLNPSLDLDREPCEWLLVGLRIKWDYRCFELYRREIDVRPEEAFSSRFADLLIGEWPTHAMVELLTIRWKAMRATNRWDHWETDYRKYREAILRAAEVSWLQLVVTAAEGIAWVETNDPNSYCWDIIQNELRDLQHLSTRHSEWFDRLDFLINIRKARLGIEAKNQAWQRNPVIAKLVHVIGRGWNAPLEDYRTDLENVIGTMLDDPREWLRTFDQIWSNGPAVLSAFGELLQRTGWAMGTQSETPSADSLQLILNALLGSREKYPMNFRELFLEVFLREAIDPAWLIDGLYEQTLSWNYMLTPEPFLQLLEDWPLRYLCMANRLFWS